MGRLDDRLVLWMREREEVRMTPQFSASSAQWKIRASQQRLINTRTLT